MIMPVQLMQGDLLKQHDVDAIVNTVNCVGVMGKGIALQFKNKWPENYEAYRAACKAGAVRTGRMFVFDAGAYAQPHYIINFPTKEHWKGKSRIEYIVDGLADLVEALVTRRVTDLLSMARKAGDAVTGYEKVKEWLVSGRAVALLQASDGSERGKTKLRPPKGENSLISCLNAGEIGLAFGRERAIHAALAAGGLTTRVVEEAARLAGLRMGSGQHDGGKPAEKDTKDA